MRKKGSVQLWILLILFLIMLFIALLYFKPETPTIGGGTSPSKSIQDKLDNPPLGQETCTLSAGNTRIEVDELITVRLSDGANTQCKIYYKKDNKIWIYYDSVTTDSSGDFRDTSTIQEAGTYKFIAVCGDCYTNYITIIVRESTPTDTDGDGTPDSSDLDDDGDGWSDAEEEQFGTDPLDPSDNPDTVDGCMAFCENLGFLSGRISYDGSSGCDTDEVARDYGTEICCCQVEDATSSISCCGMSGAKGCYERACSSSETTLGTYGSILECNNLCLGWYCCSSFDGTAANCRLNGCLAGETYSSTYTSESECESACSAPPLPLMTQEECWSYSISHGFDSARLTVSIPDPVYWTPGDCLAEATSDCNAYQPSQVVDDYAVIQNCCMWECKT